ncbi:MAG: RNA polymerase subunit sigma-24 [Thalassospira sp.]|uniref:RNA polymerase sigma factor n=1 Tax=unclassified Thalassospira TaxID=2648997 RepID=UPI000C40FACC|nr:MULTISPECIES: RNA polymerase sigma factor [unclassified Thalassospira]MBE69446.1 RNA polymerase subunit sigma-24 [Thalassospira sp.]QPO12949.1 RNA polymerase sigma factor [Thalassospira sp. A40-3]HAI29524.1 RNA polymerase subunit sigma-24 [Thalassospira sp.]|tara:strand:- start:237 stop:755 length:519 start_codon:yes stop_codon:yes gene_type:complete
MKPWQNTLSKLFEDHRRQLVSMANRRIGDRETADEIVQDVYARLLLSGDHGTDEENVKVLYASVRNAVIDHHRSTAGRTGLMRRILPVQLWQRETSSPHDHAQSRQALSALDRALLELSPKAREMFVLHRVEGVSNAKLAQKYGISVSAVEKQLARTMRHCQQRLEAYRDTD